MRHMNGHERTLLALALLHSADRWVEMADRLALGAQVVAQSLRTQAAYARALADDVTNANGVVLL
jgi:hypothetical protein